ncbi:MAG TPA: RelA/SpoT family protein [Sphaerochaeta sp.]|jgi:guanosine-3',5'-bis(diphosphate) 3'-pyrophosphohydrolase|nr:RelA/SpoT family protein [Spirochaetota bacterium]NLV60105.1 bifunctional (p)ppGpp synthetase/guanosine-3',5'-bis(diphosphate) 3'-pyrophosphohydrolase [Spirochaetales bacterium]HOE83890.1 RelA/SpoT family protein [Sphaerochaeta sp.]HOQ93854.1 RelA/SpoT family protein [Sphaerochaeta sp.]HPK46291.1 RelA/SpoT family protein [Sphaerochaeta sp.]
MSDHLIERFIQKANQYSAADQEKFLAAANFAAEKHKDQRRASGEPYIIHPLAVAEILIQLKMDSDTVCAGLLHDTLEDTDTTYEELVALFGTPVADMVEGETKIANLKTMSKSVAEAETIRKMFFAMSKDIRVIIIKLADKLHNMRTLQHLNNDRAREIASDTLDIFAPLADRLGISWLKDELEDLSLKTLKPDTFNYIQEYLLSKKSAQRAYLSRVEKSIYRACAEAELNDVLVTSRAKHTYSIYMKMKKRKKEIDEIFDILGVRILCNTVTECYTILGVVHRLWPPIEGRFKDYIAMPKANNYQSLHTTVMALDGKLLEIQIRTKEMHFTAEFGVAAHWTYKSASGSEAGSWSKMDSEQFSRIISKLKTWSNEIETSESYMDDIKGELLKDTIYVFTPQGHIVELPANATALDFAYQIHTEIGNHTTGAKADGSIIPLNAPLKNTQVIEILTSPNARPHLQWLRYAQTNSARRKIRAWLNKYDENILIDKEIIAKRKVTEPVKEIVAPSVPLDDENIVRHVQDAKRIKFRVGDEKNMMINIAQCCSPVRGDDIVGYVSRGRGIIVHRRDCPNLKNMSEIVDRSIEVEWENEHPKLTKRFSITSKRTYDLFGEIEGALRKFKGHLIEGRLYDDEEGKLAGTFTMEMEKEEDFKKILKNLKTIPSVNTIAEIK